MEIELKIFLKPPYKRFPRKKKKQLKRNRAKSFEAFDKMIRGVFPGNSIIKFSEQLTEFMKELDNGILSKKHIKFLYRML